MPSYDTFVKKYLAASSVSAAVYFFFLVIVYRWYGVLSFAVGIPLMAAPWFYFFRRRPAPALPVDARAPRAADTVSPPAAAPGQPVQLAKPSEDPADFYLRQTVSCQQCRWPMTIDMPRKDSTGKILVARLDDMLGFAFRCRDCNYVTCARCALRASDPTSPRQGVLSCPNCGTVAVPFFAEWLTIKGKERAAQRAAITPSASSTAEESAPGLAPIQQLLRTPYTCAMYARVRDVAGTTHTCFLLHEEEARVHALPAQVAIEARAALIEIRGVGVVVVLLKVGEDLYETYWNYHIPEIRECFDDMASQGDLLIRFYSSGMQPTRTLSLPNTLRDTFAKIEEELSARSPWRMEQFDAAKAALAVDFPTVQALWNGIGEQHPASGRP